MVREKVTQVSPGRNQLRQSVAHLQKVCSLQPRLGVVLGSGFQDAVARMRVEAEISYAVLPGFPSPKVRGHCGKVLLGHLGGTQVLVLSGRSHYYEGHSMEAVTFPIRVLAAFGIRDLLLTNAAGGINRGFRPGDFVVIRDHINFMPTNPLRGELAEGRLRFVDMSEAYDERLNRMMLAAAKSIGLRARTGVYLAVPGPSYETPAEIRAFARLGADLIGMSTAPETVVARQCGVCVTGLSCVANLAAGRGASGLSHAEVLATGKRVAETAADLLEAFAELYAKKAQS